MDIIKRKILLEDFINRQSSRFVSIDGTNMGDGEKEDIWGKIPMNIVIQESDESLFPIGMHMQEIDAPLSIDGIDEWNESFFKVSNLEKIYKMTNTENDQKKYYRLSYMNVLPLIDGDEYTYMEGNVQYSSIKQVLSYQTLIKLRMFLYGLLLTTKVYYKCGGIWQEVDDDEVTDSLYKYFYNPECKIITTDNGVSIGVNVDTNAIPVGSIKFYENIAQVNESEAHEFVFINDEAVKFNKIFRQNTKKRYECMLWELYDSVISGSYEGELHKPYLNLSLYFEESINSLGLYKTLQDSETLLSGNSCGYNLVADEYTQIVDNNPLINARVKSQLTTLKRKKESVSEDGEMLPFIINEVKILKSDAEGERYTPYENKKLVTDIPYNVGIVNVYNTMALGNDIYVDVIKSITFSDENNSRREVWEYDDKTGVTNITKADGSTSIFLGDGISYVDILKDETVDKGTVTFTYLIGAIMGSDGYIKNGSGIKYQETHTFERKTDFFNYKPLITIDNEIIIDRVIDNNGLEDNTTAIVIQPLQKNIGKKYKVEGNDKLELHQILIKLEYIDITYSMQPEIDVILSDISYGGEIISGDDFINGFVVKEEYMNNIEDKVEKIDVYIDRGSCASFERHNILSEINTMQDLENYRNNFFKLK